MRQWLERIMVQGVAAPALSRPFGWLAERPLPGPLLRGWIRLWIRAYGVDMAEAALPVGAYPTFNAFFTRALRPGARPLGQANLLAPCDARLQTVGAIPPDGILEQIKSRGCSLSALLGGEQQAAPFASGSHATLYLSPAMYHRVHAPLAGHIVRWHYLPGRLHPVNAVAVRHVDALFAVNERVVIHLEAADGAIAVVMVGATNVGRMTFSHTDLVTNASHPPGVTLPRQPIPVAAGDELGVFNLGSTVVLLSSRAGLRLSPEAIPGQLVRLGQPLFTTD